MHLESLEIAGFKSFPKKTSLEFTSPITGIVGPNGSGKSNIAEAFRFVLGEQSIKSLRGKRGEDMIWNGGGDSGGGTGGARANRASAKLVFDNRRKLFPSVDFDEVAIERVVYRDNTNEYLLNSSQVRLKDIVELLGSAHIGATGHHIISQGEADRILSASVRERRDMIEDALGLKVYQWKKVESLRKLERTEENMKQVESLRREIAPHIKFLKKQVEKAEKAEELRRELVAMYQDYFAREDGYISAEKARLGGELAGPKNELAELEAELERTKKIITGSKNKDAKGLEIVKLEGELDRSRTEKDSIVRELGRLEGEMAAHKRAIEREKEKQKREESKTVELLDVEEIVEKVASLEAVADAKALFKEVMDLLKSFVARHRAASGSAAIADLERDTSEVSHKHQGLEEKFRHLMGAEKELVREYNNLKSAVEKEKDTDREAEKDVFRIIARQNEIRNTVAVLTAGMNAIARAEENLKRELAEAGMVAGREAIQYTVLKLPHGPRSEQEERLRKIERNKVRLEDSGASGASEVMKEYKETEERDAFLARELVDLEKAKAELRSLIAELDLRIDHEFKTGISKINAEFQKFFTLMFGGGMARLEVVKEMRRKKKSETEELGSMLSADETMAEAEEGEGPEGLDVDVSLPRKKIKGLMMLSGGERALTSIALLFAVSQVNPPPFIILDETDAALDEANSKKYGDMIEDLSKHSQLILITHNRETMSRSGVLYGITMGSDGASKLLSIAFEEAMAVAK
ncbi:MAG: chromosome segregation protein [Candidatus Parcubacteria bacterium]|jgi:chromosome segregation protein|nr:chromosome segregation protein [Candidatus Parcubacteria bacterium]